MLEGWSAQRSRRHRAATIESSVGLVRRFQAHNGEFPWAWTPAHLEDWDRNGSAGGSRRDALDGAGLSRERSACSSVTCVTRCMAGRRCESNASGLIRCRSVMPWNMAVHRSEFEAQPTAACVDPRRVAGACSIVAMTRWKRCVVRRRKGCGGGVSGRGDDQDRLRLWVAGDELVHLDVHDFARNPKAGEFGEFGVCNVRFGKASAGSAPKRRGVLTMMRWSVEVVEQWVNDVWPHCRHQASAALWPSSGRSGSTRNASTRRSPGSGSVPI